jgi:4-hydroxy-tetrahydrodipicolinate synthase
MIQAYNAGKVTVASDIHLRLLPLFKALFITTNPIPIKQALKLQGWEVGSTRLPLSEADAEVSQKLEAVLKNLDLI